MTHNYLTVKGRRFHYIWLRDNCCCPACREPNSFQKIFQINSLKEPPQPQSVEVTDNQLKITWQEKEPCHQSIFSIPWLLSHSYDQQNGYGDFHQKISRRNDCQILWDRPWLEANFPKKYDVQTDNSDGWKNQVITLGFALLSNTDDLTSLAHSIGPLNQSEEGDIYRLINLPRSDDLGQTGAGISAHNDNAYRDTSNLLAFLHCIESQATGGESILMDGFRVAEDFQRDHPNYFQILAETPIQFQKFNTTQEIYHRRESTLFELNSQGKVIAINFHPFRASNWNIPFEKMELYYEAYQAFLSYLENPDYTYSFRLEPGDCLVFQNVRLFHGRRAFDPTSGTRHLQLTYVEWDYFWGKENYKRFKHLYLNS
ncbi:MAG: TauD/TfdA family dioxygenase [Cyanobacteria bacterium P01_B01_bin.77]